MGEVHGTSERSNEHGRSDDWVAIFVCHGATDFCPASDVHANLRVLASRHFGAAVPEREAVSNSTV